MRIKPLLDKLNPKTFLSDLLTAYGVRDIETYLSPSSALFDDPLIYPNMSKAIHLLGKAKVSNKPIGTLIDEDADGALSAGIIVDFLKSIGIKPIVFFHTEKAHGLSNDVFDIIKQANLGLLILPDSGTNDFERCTELHKSGCEVLILDHHNIEHDNPDAVVVNPHLKPDTLNCAISGAGVAYKFVQACCDVNDIEYPNYMDMVAFSIISDVCDLTSYENRAFVEFGLKEVKNE